MWLRSFELIQYPTEVNGRWVKPTSLLMGVPICMSTSLFWSRLLFSANCSLFPFSFCIFQYENTACTLPLWGVPCDTRNTSLSVLYVALAPEEANGKHWGLMVLREVFLISPISCVLSSCSPLYPQCVLHLPQFCRDNLHSPSSLAATPSCPWAKKSPYCSKEHMQQSLMLTLIVPIQTTQ